jgi:hypothetical protein
VLFRLKRVGHVFASVVLLPPRNGILEASKANVCSLMNTYPMRFAIGSPLPRLQELSKMFKRVQQMPHQKFKL